MAHTFDEKTTAQLNRAKEHFEQMFGKADRYLAVHAPGRSEIAGNHTDHEGGHVIAGALDVAIDAICAPNNLGVIRVASVGYDPFEVDYTNLEPTEAEYLSTKAIVRGMAANLVKLGFEPSGFDMAVVSNVPGGGGLSSSAAFEAAAGRAMEALWEGGSEISAVKLAQMSQNTENVYFGKPCGLMDQLAVCLGGLAFMNFEDPAEPKAEKLDLNFEDYGYALCLVDVGCDHVAFTDEYAAVPVEMQKVAAAFGKARLSEVPVEDFQARVNELREELGDRALLRAIHYWYENDLVDKRWVDLQNSDIESFIALTNASGASSGMYLQNVSTSGSYQPAMLALGLAESILKGSGAVRIHGGGFGGSIQCFVPLALVETFIAQMNQWFGEGACRHYAISDQGACAQWL